MARQKGGKEKKTKSTSKKLSFSADLIHSYKQKKIKREKRLVLFSIITVFLFILLGIGANVFLPRIPSAKVVKGIAVKQEQIVVGLPVKWTMLVERSQIEKDKYLAKLPKGAGDIKISTISASQADSILSSKPKEKLSLDQRQQLADFFQKEPANVVGESKKQANIFDVEIAPVPSDAINSSLNQNIISSPDATYVDLSSQVPVSEVVPSPEVTPTPEVAPLPEAVQSPEVTPTPEVAPSSGTTIVPVLTAINITPLTADLTVGGETQQLVASTLDQNGSAITADIVWSSDDASVATVDATGMVTAHGVGTANITASSGSVTSSAPAIITVAATAPTDYVAVQYTTPAPQAVTVPTDTGEQVTVSATNEDPTAPLVDIIASAKIPKIFKVGGESKIQIKWRNNGNQNVIFHAYDTDGDGYLDYVEWTVPHLSDQIFDIIFISKAFQLDENQNIVADIYDQVKTQDGIYATVTDTNYVRFTFEKTLADTNDITVYARPTSSTGSGQATQPASIQVYPVYTDADGNQAEGPQLVAVSDGINPDFSSINNGGKYRILLSNLQIPTDVFDVKISGNIDIDYVVDPINGGVSYYWTGGVTNSNTGTVGNWSLSAGACAANSGNINLPGPNDDVHFGGTGGCQNSATINLALSVYNFYIDSTYTVGSGTGTVTQSAGLTVGGALTVSAGTLAVGTQTLAVTGSSTVTGGTLTIGAGANGWTSAGITIGTGGTVTCSGASKITDSGNWDSSVGIFTSSSTSRIFLTGTGTLKSGGANYLGKMQMAAAGKTTTLMSTIYVNVASNLGGLVWGGGTVNFNGNQLNYYSNTETFDGNGTTVSGGGTLDVRGYYGTTTTLTNLNLGTTAVRLDTAATAMSTTFILSGSVTCGTLMVVGGTNPVSAYRATLNTAADSSITCSGLDIGGNTAYTGQGSFDGTAGGTVNVNGNVSFGSKTYGVNLGSSTLNVTGSWTNSSSIAVNPGSSTVNLTGTVPAAQILSGVGSSFYNLTQNGSGGTYILQDNMTVSHALTITAGTLACVTNNLTAASLSNSGLITTSTGVVSIPNASSGDFLFSWNNAIPAATYSNLTIDNSLAGVLDYWKMDEGTGLTTADSSVYAHTGTLVGPPTWGSSVPSAITFTDPYALTFNGTSQYVSTYNFSPTSSQPFSICLWVNQASLAGNRVILGKGTSGGSDWQYSLRDINGTVGFLYWNTGGSGALSFSLGTLSPNTWTHLCAVFDGTTGYGYKDGIFQGSGISSGSFKSDPGNLNIGKGYYSGGVYGFFNGSIDEVRIYNRALSATDVYWLSLGQPGTYVSTDTLAGTTNVTNNLILNGGTLSAGSNTINVGGSWLNSGGIFGAGTSTVNLNGTGPSNSILSAGQHFNNLTISNSGTWVLGDRLYADGTLANSAGTLDASTSNYVIQAGAWNQTGGTFIPRSGTVVLNSATNQTCTPNSAFNTLRVEDPADNGIVGYWKLDEQNGTNAKDSSGNNSAGTLIATPVRTTSVSSGILFDNPYALTFNGTSQYVNIGTLGSFGSQRNNITISAWVNMGSNTSMSDIYGGNDVYLSGRNGISLRVNANHGNTLLAGSIRVAMSSDEATPKILSGATDANSLPINGWHIVTAIITPSTNTIIIYVDGVSQPVTYSYQQTPAIFNNFIFAHFIGAFDGAGQISNFFSGSIDDVRIYNRALTTTEVANLAAGRYAAGSTGTATQTLGGNLTTGTLVLDSGNLNTSSSNVTINNTFTLTNGNGTFTGGSGTCTLNGGLTLTGGTFTGVSGDITDAGALNLTSGSLTSTSGNLFVSGNLTNTGTFSANGGTVNLNGTTQTISGNTTFNNLTIDRTHSPTIYFTSGSIQAINGAFTATGDSGHQITIGATTTSAATLSKPSGTVSVNYCNISYSAASGGAGWYSFIKNGNANNGNNTGWVFTTTPVAGTPSDGGSYSGSPTNVGSPVAFTETATDTQTGNYYLAVCKTTGIQANSNAVPTCTGAGGSWCVSGSITSGSQASCNYTPLSGDAESNDWYAYVCDDNAGSTCSAYSQGSGNTGTPFFVNHAPTFTSISSSPSSVSPGAQVTFTAVSTDQDTITSDTIALYICKSNDFTGSDCGPAGKFCNSSFVASYPSGPVSPSCAYTTQYTDGIGAISYYAYIVDNHNFVATANPRSGSFTIANVLPTSSNVHINSDATDVILTEGATQNVTCVSTIADVNGYSDISTITARLYRSGVGPSPIGGDDNSNHYTLSGSKVTYCTGSGTSGTCTFVFPVQYYADPTDASSNSPAENWVCQITPSDGVGPATSPATSTIEMDSLKSFDISSDTINYGTVDPTQSSSGSRNVTVTNTGNTAISFKISGNNLSCSMGSSAVPVGDQQYNLDNNFDYGAGTPLSASPTSVATLNKPTQSTPTIQKNTYWQVTVPGGTRGTCSGATSFVAD